MRKLIVLSFITLDGVMQAPGGPEEDPTGGFKHGGWIFGYFDDFLLKAMVKQMTKPFDLLLGRKTYEIFAAYWPHANTSENPFAARINNAKKYVASKTMPTLSIAVLIFCVGLKSSPLTELHSLQSWNQQCKSKRLMLSSFPEMV